MTPEQMAKASGEVSASWNYLLGMAGEIRNPLIRSKVMDILTTLSSSGRCVRSGQSRRRTEDRRAVGRKKEPAPGLQKG